MKADQACSSERSFARVGRIPETHKKTTSTGTTFRDKRHILALVIFPRIESNHPYLFHYNQGNQKHCR